jgi:hypothetical protein
MDKTSTQSDTTTPKRSGLPWWVWVCVSVPLVYILSSGPVAKLGGLGYIHEPLYSAVTVIYAPLRWLGDICPPFEHFIDWYQDLWGTNI